MAKTTATSSVAPAVDAAQAAAARRAAAQAPARRALRSPRIVISALFLLMMAVLSVAAPLIAPHDPTQLIAKPLQDPNPTYPLGTDDFGRDALSRLIYAGRVSLGVSVSSVVVATLIGVWLGLFAGFYRGATETIIMRSMDLILSFPTIVLAIAIVAMLGASLPNIVLVIAIVYIPRFVRIVYGATLAVRELEFIQAARVAGATDLPDHPPERPPERADPDLDPGLAEPWLRDPRRDRALVPGIGRPAADAFVGQYGGRRAALHGDQRLAAAGACRGGRPDDPGAQYPRRWPARPARPAPARHLTRRVRTSRFRVRRGRVPLRRTPNSLPGTPLACCSQ